MDITVVIPTYNRSDALLRTLAALAANDYTTGAWEAIVVDDGSVDDTEESVRKWIATASVLVRYERQSNSGPARARNLGAKRARGRVTIFIDNDIVVGTDFLRRHFKAIESNPGCWIMGRIVNPPELRRSPFGRYRDRTWEQFHTAHAGRGLQEIDGLSAANLSVVTQSFRDLGGFDEEFTIASCEDCELGMRARAQGIRVLYDPELEVLHNDWVGSLESLCERQRLYSISDVLLWKKYGALSPRAELVKANGWIDLRHDGVKTVLRKVTKRVLAPGPMRKTQALVVCILESVAPDTRLLDKAYTMAIAVAIQRGVREGLVRYSN